MLSNMLGYNHTRVTQPFYTSTSHTGKLVHINLSTSYRASRISGRAASTSALPPVLL